MVLPLIFIGAGFFLMLLSKNSKHRMKILMLALVLTVIGIVIPFTNL